MATWAEMSPAERLAHSLRWGTGYAQNGSFSQEELAAAQAINQQQAQQGNQRAQTYISNQQSPDELTLGGYTSTTTPTTQPQGNYLTYDQLLRTDRLATKTYAPSKM